ncbi:uncharacterized protein LOC110885971 isoform X2 [Helianthus annuus]|uniref:uncharacterized protein LOC110885971 isoform X2 n=1 Tax=Helianthus annuus TaxID=4232 RepID=UPI001652C1C6|nr:uncharacterized protein LOC110885971 isoform X2 [Helianthus annuus]
MQTRSSRQVCGYMAFTGSTQHADASALDKVLVDARRILGRTVVCIYSSPFRNHTPCVIPLVFDDEIWKAYYPGEQGYHQPGVFFCHSSLVTTKIVKEVHIRNEFSCFFFQTYVSFAF